MSFKVFFHGRPIIKPSCKDGPDGRACDVCRAASARARKVWRDARTAALAKDPTLQPHGKINTYQNWGCRCDQCRTVATATRYQFAYNRPSPDGTTYEYRPHAQPFGREWLDAAPGT